MIASFSDITEDTPLFVKEAKSSAIKSERGATGDQATVITNSTDPVIIVTANEDFKLDLTHLVITNSSVANCLVTLSDGETDRGKFLIRGGGGMVLPMDNFPMEQAVADTDWTLTCGSSTDSIYVFAKFKLSI